MNTSLLFRGRPQSPNGMVVGKGRLLTDGLNRAAFKTQIPISN
jgi:hypothetical protein